MYDDSLHKLSCLREDHVRSDTDGERVHRTNAQAQRTWCVKGFEVVHLSNVYVKPFTTTS